MSTTPIPIKQSTTPIPIKQCVRSNFFFFTPQNPNIFPIAVFQTVTHRSFIRNFCSSNSFPDDVYSLVADKLINAETRARDELCRKVAHLGEELIRRADDDDEEEIDRVLDEKGLLLFRIYSGGGEAFTELLGLLVPLPSLAIKAANWRRKQADYCNPMTPEEYAKLTWLAGKVRNLDLAVEIFVEACNKRIKTNVLMAVYMRHGLAEKC